MALPKGFVCSNEHLDGRIPLKRVYISSAGRLANRTVISYVGYTLCLKYIDNL